jgi:predicted ABC-type ATPase
MAVVLAGPNGAGKSSAAPHLLRGALHVDAFVNADVIAQGLSAFDPDAVAAEAGRILLRRLGELIDQRANFGWETTLSGNTARHLFQRLNDAGYAIHLIYLWLPSAEMAIERVRRRVELGGHDIPEPTIRRRFARSLVNFQTVYRPLSSAWQVFDNREAGVMRLVAAGLRGTVNDVVDAELWRMFGDQCAEVSKVRERQSSYAGETMVGPTDVGHPDADAEDEFDRGAVFRDGVEIERALTRAHGDVIRRHRAFGVPLVIWRDGRVQSVDPNDVPIPDPDAVQRVPIG